MYSIYKLINPKTYQVFYVGITPRTLDQRLYEHIRDSSFEPSCVQVYIKNMGCIPIIELIKKTENKNEEQLIIEEYSKHCNICNVLNKYFSYSLSDFRSLFNINGIKSLLKSKPQIKRLNNFFNGSYSQLSYQEKQDLKDLVSFATKSLIDYIDKN